MILCGTSACRLLPSGVIKNNNNNNRLQARPRSWAQACG